MPIKETLSDETLYFVDTETGERSIFGGITEVNLITEEEKESSERFKWGESETAVFSIENFSIRDAYLKCLKDGIDVIWVPNNFRRTHGYKVRRLSLRKKKGYAEVKDGLEETKSAIKTSPIIEYMNLYRF